MSIFDKAREQIQDKFANRQHAQSREYKAKQDAHLKKLQKDAEDFLGIIRDVKYSGYQRFLEELKQSLHRMMQVVCLTIKSKDERDAECLKISAQIELLDHLRTKPDKAMDTLKKFTPSFK